MKKGFSIARLLWAAPLLLAAQAADAQSSSTGQIKLFGRIYASACEVEINGQDSSGNATIPMGNYPVSAFPAAGTVVGGSDGNGVIDIALSNCPPDKTTVDVELDATAIGGTYANAVQLDNATSNDTAQNIGIYLYKENDLVNPVALNTAQQYNLVQGTNGKVNVKFIAKYVSTAASVAAGLANGTVNYTLTYN